MGQHFSSELLASGFQLPKHSCLEARLLGVDSLFNIVDIGLKI